MRIRLPELLKEHDVTAYRLAQLTGVPSTTIYRLARNHGKMSFISGHLVETIAKALDVDLADVLELEGTGRRVRRKRGQ